MTRYLFRRFLSMLFVIYMIYTITFILAYLIPADPARAIAGPKANPETLAQIRENLGLNDPIHVQYVRYLGRALHGDLGLSYKMRQPVTQIILMRLPATVQLAVLGVLAEIIFGIPIGIVSAVRQGSLFDRAAMLLALFGIAAPPFWLGLVLLYLFGFRLPILPLGGPGGLAHMILPGITLGAAGTAWYARMLRSSMLDLLQADFVRTARAKGLSERAVLLRHVLKNAIQPIITMLGMDLGYYLGGLLFIEQVFSWPGIGRELYRAVANLDIPLIVGTVTYSAVAIVVMNFLVDLLYTVIDPRVRLA